MKKKLYNSLTDSCSFASITVHKARRVPRQERVPLLTLDFRCMPQSRDRLKQKSSPTSYLHHPQKSDSTY